MKFIKYLFCIHILIVVFSIPSFGAWETPETIVSGKWGDNATQFGYEHGDVQDAFPNDFDVSIEGDVVISDIVNGSVKIYNNDGVLINSIKPPVSNPRRWVIRPFFLNSYIVLILDKIYFYSTKGDLINKIDAPIIVNKYSVTNDGLFLEQFNPTYKAVLISSSGEMIKVYKNKPIELGIIDAQRSSSDEKKFRTLVRYPDHVYEILSNQPFKVYNRDGLKNLYRIDSFTEKSDKEYITVYQVFKYEFCENKEIKFEMPKSDYESRPPEADKYPIWKAVPIIEYGEPQISPGGNIYCWARTKTEYKILKWTWQGEPDTPQSLTAKRLEINILLDWKPPTQKAEEVEGYEIVRSTDVCGSFKPIESVAKGVLHFEDKTVEKSTTYYYHVRAVKKEGYSSYSNKAVGLKK